MVVSSIVTVGNYEYAYYWYLYQDGTIEYEVKLSGVISNGVVAEGQKPEYGVVVAPGVYGPHHQHFFNVRLDMAVDGTTNRVYEVTPTADPEGPDNIVGNAWRAKEVLIADETMARRDADPLAGRYWKITNDNVKNELGQSVAYKLLPNHQIRPFAHPGSAVARRAPFMFNPVWVTAYDKDELFATGDYPNQAVGGAGLPAFVARERNLTDTDVVVWFTFGTNHVVRPEDWPVMPVHPIGFKLLPSGFFVGNPSLDNPQPGADHCHHQ
jgi:primary-amine oxidase